MRRLRRWRRPWGIPLQLLSLQSLGSSSVKSGGHTTTGCLGCENTWRAAFPDGGNRHRGTAAATRSHHKRHVAAPMSSPSCRRTGGRAVRRGHARVAQRKGRVDAGARATLAKTRNEPAPHGAALARSRLGGLRQLTHGSFFWERRQAPRKEKMLLNQRVGGGGIRHRSARGMPRRKCLFTHVHDHAEPSPPHQRTQP